MGFDHFRCVLDCIFSFPKLPEYRYRFRYRKYRIAFVSDEKKYESESGGAFRRSFPTVFIPIDHRTELSGNTAESYTFVSHLNQ